MNDIFELCKVAEAKKKKFLKVCVDKKILEQLNPSKDDYRGYCDILLNLTYNLEKFNDLMYKLKHIKITKEKTVREYYTKIQKLFKHETYP